MLRAQLFALTGVEPDRQKLMIKGKTVKVGAAVIDRALSHITTFQDEDTWAQHGVKDGSMMMMMGTAGEVPVAPVQQTVFIEDLDVNSQSAIVCLGRPN